MWTNIFSIIDVTGNLLGIIGAIISFLVWLRVKKQNQKLNEFALTLRTLDDYQSLQNTQEGVTSNNPKAFCLSLIPNDVSIKNRVEQFINSQPNLSKMPIVELNIDGLSADSVGYFIDEVRRKRRGELSDASEIHLFIQGPIIAGTLIGAIFDHWIPVKLYHYNSRSFQYEYWGPLIKQ